MKCIILVLIVLFGLLFSVVMVSGWVCVLVILVCLLWCFYLGKVIGLVYILLKFNVLNLVIV